MTEGGDWHVALQDVRRQLALTEDEKIDLIESVEGEAYTVKHASAVVFPVSYRYLTFF